MIGNRTKQIKRNMGGAMLLQFISMVFPFVIRTLMIQKLGDEYLGLNSLCTSILEVLNIANLGMDRVLVGRLYKPVADGNTEEICGLYHFYNKIYYTLAGTILVGGVIVLPFLSHFIAGSAPAGINVYAVFFLYLVSSANTYVSGACVLICRAHQKENYMAYSNVISLSISYVFQIVAIYYQNYYAYVFLLLMTSTIYNLLIKFMVKKNFLFI